MASPKPPRTSPSLLLYGCALVLTAAATTPHLHAQSEPGGSGFNVVITSKPNPLEGEARKAEESFRTAQKASAGLDEQVAMLALVVNKHRQLTESANSTDLQSRHLQELVVELATLRARLLTPRIVVSRAEGEKALAEAQYKSASEKLRTALDWQRTINQSAAPASAKDVSSESTLSLLLLQAEAIPATEAVAQELLSARQAVKDSRLDEAKAGYARARIAQSAINKRFVGTTFASQSILTQIDAELTAAQAEIPLRDIQKYVAQADLAESAGQLEAAARLLVTAMTKQRELAKYFPSAASAGGMNELERKYQTVLSAPQVDAVAALDAQCAEALRNGVTQLAVTLARQALETLENARLKFPKSNRIDATLIRKFTYIGFRENELSSIHDQVRSQLRPVPGHPGLLMQKAEVPQTLYTQVMNANPSRNTGGTLPVDSINWEEAATFCKRLSWLMGTTVRLPTQEEWQAAIGSDNTPAWTAETSNNRSQEAGSSSVNARGFADLQGNVAEWLQPLTPASPEAPVAGGSYLDTAEAIRQTPVKTVDRTARNRYIGFRVLVESK